MYNTYSTLALSFFKYFGALLLSLIVVLEPTVPYAVILFFAIIADCVSAYDLGRRVKKQNPGMATGKFQSRYALRMFNTFMKVYAVLILAHWVDAILLKHMNNLYLANWGAALFCALQLWSILENISSANGARWAKILQIIMVDKAKRHLDIDLTLNDEEKENEKN